MSGFISYLPESLLSPFLSNSPASTPPSSSLLSFLSSTTSTALSFLSLTPSPTNTTGFSFSLGSWNQWWNAAVEVHPALFGFGGGKVLEWLCFACRVMAYVCTGPFAFLILLDLTGYVLARTLHVPSQRVRVRPVPSSNPSITTSPPDEPIPISSSSGVSSAINVHPLKSPSTPDEDGSPEIMLRGLSSSSSISSAASSVAGDVSPSAGLGLGLEGVGSGSGSVKMAGKVASGEGGGSTTRRRIPGSLSISPLPSSTLPQTQSSSSYNINTYPLSSSSSTSSASSSITSSPESRFMTTPGERHAILPPSRDLSPEPSSIPLPPDTDEGDERLERRRRRAASIGVEGALGFMNDDDDDDEESEGEGKEGALRTRRGTIRPGEGREE